MRAFNTFNHMHTEPYRRAAMLQHSGVRGQATTSPSCSSPRSPADTPEFVELSSAILISKLTSFSEVSSLGDISPSGVFGRAPRLGHKITNDVRAFLLARSTGRSRLWIRRRWRSADSRRAAWSQRRSMGMVVMNFELVWEVARLRREWE